MAIASAKKTASLIRVFNEKGHQLWMKPGDELLGYTNSTVTIRIARTAYTYDEKGRQVGQGKPI